MKIFSFFLILLTTIAFQSNAQSYYLSMNGEELAVDATITIVPDTITSSEIMFGLNFHNNTNAGANIKVLRNEISTLDGTSNLFTWVEQYDDTINLSLESSYIPAGSYSVDGLFSANYIHNDVVGVSIVEYTFFNIENLDENVKVTVNFDTTPQSIDDIIFNNSWVSDIYPNPASHSVTVDYAFPNDIDGVNVKIMNILGTVVKQQKINLQNSSLTIDVSNIKSGMYFYNVFINANIISTKKLIIR